MLKHSDWKLAQEKLTKQKAIKWLELHGFIYDDLYEAWYNDFHFISHTSALLSENYVNSWLGKELYDLSICFTRDDITDYIYYPHEILKEMCEIEC